MQQGVTLKICNVHIGSTQHCDKMKYGGQIFAQATVDQLWKVKQQVGQKKH